MIFLSKFEVHFMVLRVSLGLAKEVIPLPDYGVRRGGCDGLMYVRLTIDVTPQATR